MFADITWDKLVYDLFIALLTGVFTGLLVDFLLRRREKRRSVQEIRLMYGDLLEMTDELLFTTVPIKYREVSSRLCLLGPDLEIYITAPPVEMEQYIEGTPKAVELEDAAKSA